MRFEILTAVTMKKAVFCDETLRRKFIVSIFKVEKLSDVETTIAETRNFLLLNDIPSSLIL
jgi:hypothetical protein